jgi:hypothetical protein
MQAISVSMDKETRVTPAAYSIDQFCIAHGNICRASYYNMKKAGKGPREMRVGSRVLISQEAAAEWRRAREAEARPQVRNLENVGSDDPLTAEPEAVDPDPEIRRRHADARAPPGWAPQPQ